MNLTFVVVLLTSVALLVMADSENEEEELDLEVRGRRGKKSKYNGECGARRLKRTSSSLHRIVGGKSSNKGEFPWQVMITKQGGMHCGGVIIDENTIVTAAHCFASSNCFSASSQERFFEILESTDAAHNDKVRNLKPCKYEKAAQFEVIAGITAMDMKSERKQKQVRKIAKIFVSDEYITYTKSNAPALHNDVAVLTLSEPFSWTDRIRPACLPDKSLELKPGRHLIVTGFGALYEGAGRPSGNLMQARVTLFSPTQCDEFYSDVVSDSMFCAGVSAGGVDACQGDSGGPIGMDDRANNKFTVVGVVSWGYGCARKGLPGVYTELSKFLDFIDSARKDEIEPVSEY